MMQNLGEEVRGVERQFASYVVAPLIEAIKHSYPDSERVLQVSRPRARLHSRQSVRFSGAGHDAGHSPAVAGRLRRRYRIPIAGIQGQRHRGQQPDPDGAGFRGGGAHVPQPLRQHRPHGRSAGPAGHQLHPDQGGQPAARQRRLPRFQHRRRADRALCLQESQAHPQERLHADRKLQPVDPLQHGRAAPRADPDQHQGGRPGQPHALLHAAVLR